MKSLKFTFLLLACSLAVDASAQHFIGMHKDDLSQLMKQEYKYFKLNTEAINDTYNYLKYEDRIHEMTMLFFMTDDNKCKLVRMMCDYSNINDVLSDLNTNYTKIENGSWEYKADGKTFSVILEEGDWFFTVTTRKKK